MRRVFSPRTASFVVLSLFGALLSCPHVKAADAVPGNNQSAAGQSAAAYPIRSGDRLSIQVYREKDLSGSFAVDDYGNINYPLLGNIPVKGLTTDRVREILTERLGKDYIVEPQIQVDFEKSVVKSVMIMGQVGKAGNYDFTPEMTVLRLALNAGGFTPIADLGKVKIVRVDRDAKEGTKKTIRVNVKRILDGKDEDVQLESGDLVVVPESIF